MTYDIGTNVMITRKRANKQQGKTNPLKTTGKPWKTTPSKAVSRWWWFRGWYPQNCRSERIKIFMLLDADWKLRRMFPNKSTYIQYLSWFHTVAIFAWQTTLISVFFSSSLPWVNYGWTTSTATTISTTSTHWVLRVKVTTQKYRVPEVDSMENDQKSTKKLRAIVG